MPTSNSLPPRVLIFERNSDGHRLFYVRLLVEGATQRGIEPIVLTAQAAIESREWAIHLAHLESKFRLIVSNANGPRVVARVASELAVSEVLVPDADRFLLAVAKTGGWRGSSKLRGLVMRTKAQPRRVPGLQLSITAVKRLALQSLKAGRRVRILELVSALAQTPRSDQVIDPTEFRGDLPGALATREQFDLKPADFVFAILGAIDPRKNIARVLSAIRQLPPNRAVLLIAGRWSDELFEETRSARQLAERDGVRVIVENRTLSDKELDDRILMADALVVAHSNEGPSGLVAKAVAAGTSVLAAGAQSLRQDASSRPELIRWVPLNETAIAEGLRAALEQGRGPKSSPSAVALNTGFVDPFLRGISDNA